MGNRDILAIGTSAGGFQALRCLAGALPADLPASVLVVIHLASQFASSLDAILTRSGPLAATFAIDGEPLRHGHIYLAPPQCHLLVDDDRLLLGQGPRENFARPAIDPLLRSIAACCGPRAVGAVLTGTMGDGASGLQALGQCGGITVVQDPADAAYSEMPATALSRSKPDHVVRLQDMATLFEQLVKLPAGDAVAVPDIVRYEVKIAHGRHGSNGTSSMSNLDRIGRRSVLACPDCHGVMWEIDDGALARYRCHVGHAYTAELMRLGLDENLTRALGSALRALDERVALAHKLHQQATASHHRRLAEGWERKAREFEREAAVIREAIARFEQIVAEAQQDPADA